MPPAGILRRDARPGPCWRALAAVTADYAPGDDSELLTWMAAEAGGMAAYAEALTEVCQACVTTVGLDPVALAVLHAAASVAADAAVAMNSARANFAAHYSEIREFAANGGVLPFDGRWITGDGHAPAHHSGAPAPGTEPATPAVDQAVTIRCTTAHRVRAGKADPVGAADGLLGTGPPG